MLPKIFPAPDRRLVGVTSNNLPRGFENGLPTDAASRKDEVNAGIGRITGVSTGTLGGLGVMSSGMPSVGDIPSSSSSVSCVTEEFFALIG